MQASRQVDLRLHLLSVLATTAEPLERSPQHHRRSLSMHFGLVDGASLLASGQGQLDDSPGGR